MKNTYIFQIENYQFKIAKNRENFANQNQNLTRKVFLTGNIIII